MREIDPPDWLLMFYGIVLICIGSSIGDIPIWVGLIIFVLFVIGFVYINYC